MQKDTRNIRLSNTEPAFAAVIRKCLDELIFSSTYLHAEHMFFAIRSPWRLLASTKSDPPSAILSFPLRTLADHKTKLLVERNHFRRESENIPGMTGPLKLNWRRTTTEWKGKPETLQREATYPERRYGSVLNFL